MCPFDLTRRFKSTYTRAATDRRTNMAHTFWTSNIVWQHTFWITWYLFPFHAYSFYETRNNFRNVEFEVFTAVVMKSIIFWDVTQCSLFSYNRRFGASYRLTCRFLLKLFLRPWRWRRYVPPKRWLQHKTLHGVTSQKMILFNFRNVYWVSELYPSSSDLRNTMFPRTDHLLCSGVRMVRRLIRVDD
jgi:hypothetical protein